MALSPIHVITILTNGAKNHKLQSQLIMCLSSMLSLTTHPIELHLISDEPSQDKLINDLLPKTIQPMVPVDKFKLLKVRPYQIDVLTREIDIQLGDNLLSHFRHSANSYYGHNLFFLSLIADRLFPKLSKVIQLDLDLKFKIDIAQLWEEFDRFDNEQIIGIAHEQQPVYRHVFSQYRSKHPNTKLGDPPPSGITGFNSGVLMLHLEKMRTSKLYQSLLNLATIESLTEKYNFQGHLGDQDLYTLLSTDYSELFYILDCGYNRQLCTWWKDHGYGGQLFHSYHNCASTVKIYHGNCATPIPDD